MIAPAALTPPRVDIERDIQRLARDVEGACTTAGLFVLGGHGIDMELHAAFAAAKAFFALEDATKRRVPRIDRYGYVPQRRLTESTESPEAPAAYGTRLGMSAEYLDMGLADEVDLEAVEALGCDGFTTAVRRYQSAALSVAHNVLEALAVTLNVPGFFAERMSQPQCRLRLLHYPPTHARADPESLGSSGDDPAPVMSSAHTDYGAITLLALDGVAGLEVLLDGRWTAVAAEPGSLIVQLGDMLARWTNDRYRSTPHRVVGSGRTDRYSIPFFVNPDPQTVVTTIESCISAQRPERYEPVTAGEFLKQRIDSPKEPYI